MDSNLPGEYYERQEPRRRSGRTLAASSVSEVLRRDPLENRGRGGAWTPPSLILSATNPLHCQQPTLPHGLHQILELMRTEGQTWMEQHDKFRWGMKIQQNTLCIRKKTNMPPTSC